MQHLKILACVRAKSNPAFLLFFRAKPTVFAVLVGSAGQSIGVTAALSGRLHVALRWRYLKNS